MGNDLQTGAWVCTLYTAAIHVTEDHATCCVGGAPLCGWVGGPLMSCVVIAMAMVRAASRPGAVVACRSWGCGRPSRWVGASSRPPEQNVLSPSQPASPCWETFSVWGGCSTGFAPGVVVWAGQCLFGLCWCREHGGRGERSEGARERTSGRSRGTLNLAKRESSISQANTNPRTVHNNPCQARTNPCDTNNPVNPSFHYTTLSNPCPMAPLGVSLLGILCHSEP